MLAPFTRGATPREARRIGMEVEVQGVDPETGHRLPFDGPRGIERVLHRLAARGGWEPVCEGDRLVALARAGATITLEPGGQVELSTAPRATLGELAADHRGFVAELDAVAGELGVQWTCLGAHPLDTPAEVAWVPKGRYALLSRHLAATGELGHWMMKLTSGLQVALDYADEAECFDLVRTAQAVTPVVGALAANAPFVAGGPAPVACWRRHVWRETDPARCGLLAGPHEDPAYGFADYARYAAGLPMPFRLRGGVWLDPGGRTFAELLARGEATAADWELHLTSVFTEVRLKHFVEVRGCDHPGVGRVEALAALWVGLLYDETARRAAWRLAGARSAAELEELDRRAIAEGLAARAHGTTVGELARALVRLAAEGLTRLGEDPTRLEPLARLADAGRNPAAEVRAACADRDGRLDVAAWLAYERRAWRRYLEG
ncbi:MAG: glutamate--cysteine ligase [Nitrospirae bacterium]|nr:MAG: glutamate--cysteine ligase [Nitrospirota bacterium]